MEIENIVTRTLSTLLPRLFTESPLGILDASVCPHAAAPAVTGPGLWLVMHQSPGPRALHHLHLSNTQQPCWHSQYYHITLVPPNTCQILMNNIKKIYLISLYIYQRDTKIITLFHEDWPSIQVCFIDKYIFMTEFNFQIYIFPLVLKL